MAEVHQAALVSASSGGAPTVEVDRLARAVAHTSKVLPHPRRIESYIRNLLAVLETDKEAARALLPVTCRRSCSRATPPPTGSAEASTCRCALTAPAPPTRKGSGAPRSI